MTPRKSDISRPEHRAWIVRVLVSPPWSLSRPMAEQIEGARWKWLNR